MRCLIIYLLCLLCVGCQSSKNPQVNDNHITWKRGVTAYEYNADTEERVVCDMNECEVWTTISEWGWSDSDYYSGGYRKGENIIKIYDKETHKLKREYK